MEVQAGSSPHPRDRIRHLVQSGGFTGGIILKQGLTEEKARETADSLARDLDCPVHHGASSPELGWAVYVVSDAS